MTVQRQLPPTRRPLPAAMPSAVRRALPANARLAVRDELTATMGTFVVVLDEPLSGYRPGQYVSLGLASDGELVQRPYSIVSLDATRRRVELLIRRLPDGRFSNLLWRQQPGARLSVGPPRGLFVLDLADPRPRIFVGTGAGLAPLMAMLGELAARRDTNETFLLHGAAYQGEFAYAERIRSWAAAGLRLDYRPSVSRPSEERNWGWGGRSGRVDFQLRQLLAERPELVDSAAYLCGNAAMVESCSTLLAGAGCASSDIRVERFHAPDSAR